MATEILMMMTSPGETEIDTLMAAWQSRRTFQYERCRQLFAEIRGSTTQDMPMLSVALRELRALA